MPTVPDRTHWHPVRHCAQWLLVVLFAFQSVTPASAEKPVIRAQSSSRRGDDGDWPSVGRNSGLAGPGRPARTVDEDEDEDTSSSPEPNGAVGINGRIGHLAFKTFGRNGSITHAELFPYAMMDEHLIFADARFFTSNDLDYGGNLGFGYRYLQSDWDRVLGINFYYDNDQTTGKMFQQVGFGLESYGEILDVRSNFYFPIGDTEQNISAALANARFVNNLLLFDRLRKIGEAMPGADIEAGVRLYGDFARDHNLRLYGGFYHFQGSSLEDINGYRVRFEGSINDYFTAQTEYTNDPTYGSNVIIGGAIQFSGGSPRERTSSGRNTAKLMRYPQRNYNVITPTERITEIGLTAINPLTLMPYDVKHVDSTAGGGGNGEFNNPFNTIAAAQAAGGDLIFVHAGSQFVSPVNLNAGDRIYGGGVNNFVTAHGYGSLLLPEAGGQGLVKPIINGGTVSLASDTVFSGFTLNNPTNHGIVGTGVTDVLVREVTIAGAGADGIRLVNATGNLTFENVTVEDSAGVGFRVNNGDADIMVSGRISNTVLGGRPVVVENTTGGTVDLRSTTVAANGGNGVLLSSAASDVIFNGLTLLNTSGPAIDIQNSPGDMTFFGTTTITGAGTAGVRLDDADGIVQFGTLSITGAALQDGLVMNNSAGALAINQLNVTTNGGTGLSAANNPGSINIANGAITSNNGTAVDIDSTGMGIRLTSVTSNNALVGVRLVDSIGTFMVTGVGSTLGSGGLISNNVTGVQVVNSGLVGFANLDVDGNGTGYVATNTQHLELANNRVTDSTFQAIDALNTRELFVSNSLFDNNGSLGTNTMRIRADAAGTYDTRIISNTIDADGGTAISISNSGAANGSDITLLANANQITLRRMGDTAIQMNWNGTLSASLANNLIIGAPGGSNTGIDITASSAAHMASIDMTRNLMSFQGGSDTGVRITTAGSSNITLVRQEIDMNGANSTGMAFSLARNALVQVTSNVIMDHAGGGNGLMFNNLAGLSTIQINDNWIGPSGAGIVLNRGIFFNNIDTTNGLVTLSGLRATTNLVNSAFTPFAAPIGTTTGQFFINNLPVP
ncbi:MAG: right-handed parallel beta-helix repeat-containing protein [Planctomycetaceae bacterium]|nr:right-handed parallel beta-helix repeat-containing protein [Planctomycetaceae bacterium]